MDNGPPGVFYVVLPDPDARPNRIKLGFSTESALKSDQLSGNCSRSKLSLVCGPVGGRTNDRPGRQLRGMVVVIK